jgi:hypothetical protein
VGAVEVEVELDGGVEVGLEMEMEVKMEMDAGVDVGLEEETSCETFEPEEDVGVIPGDAFGLVVGVGVGVTLDRSWVGDVGEAREEGRGVADRPGPVGEMVWSMTPGGGKVRPP